jgi:hypothetical protein
MWRKSRLTVYAQAAAAGTRWGCVFEDKDSPYWSIEVGLMKKVRQLANVFSLAEPLETTLQQSEQPLADVAKNAAACLRLDEKGKQELLREGDVGLLLASLGEQITAETLIEEIELNDRLDARIDRLLKRLFQFKAAKQMIGLGSRSVGAASAPLKLIERV